MKLTIFTPTYNRKKELYNCYKHFCKQKCKDFVWLIVDDGSTDDTEIEVKKWMNEQKIHIEYIKQKNGGKYKAVNTAINNCKTELFAFCDSDDYYLDTTVDRFLSEWEKINKDETIVGIVGRRGRKNGKIVGKEISEGNKKLNYRKLENKYGFLGDTCRMYKTDILKTALYPEVDDKFVPESVMFLPIDSKYNIYYINEVLSISEYLKDGYTLNYKKLLNNNPNGFLLCLNQEMKYSTNILIKSKRIIEYIIFSKKKGIKAYHNCNYKVAYILLYPISMLLYLFGIPKWFEGNKSLFQKVILHIKLIMYFLYSFKMPKANIYGPEETVNTCIKDKKTIIRFGDGEFNFFRNIGVDYQEYNDEIKNGFNEYNSDSNYLICLPKCFFSCSGLKLLSKRRYLISWSYARYYFKRRIKKELLYGDAFSFGKQNEKYYSKIFKKSKIDRVIFVHNDEKYFKKFKNKYNLETEFVKIPRKNSYKEKELIIDNILKLIKNKANTIVLISAGPAAKMIAYELSQNEIWCIDTGHCWDMPLEVIERK